MEGSFAPYAPHNEPAIALLLIGTFLCAAFWAYWRNGTCRRKQCDSGAKSTLCAPVPRGREDSAGAAAEVGLFLAVRTDLKMSTGKTVAQCAHGAVGALSMARDASDNQWSVWLRDWNGKPDKVLYQCSSQEEIRSLRKKAAASNVPYCLVRDAGRTQIAAGSETVLAVGPAPPSILSPLFAEMQPL